MSSATSIRRARAAAADERRADAGRQAPDAQPSDNPFRVSHFFVLVSLLAATVAVMMSRQATPEHLVLMSLTIGAAGAAAYGVYRMLAPLGVTDAELASEPVSERLRHDLEREKALVLRSIKELEFDRAMSKVSAADFDEMAGRLRTRAIGIMKQLDEGGSIYRSLIEKDLQERLATTPARAASVTVVAAEPAPAPVVAGLCACGTQNDADAKFCKNCGSRL